MFNALDGIRRRENRRDEFLDTVSDSLERLLVGVTREDDSAVVGITECVTNARVVDAFIVQCLLNCVPKREFVALLGCELIGVGADAPADEFETVGGDLALINSELILDSGVLTAVPEAVNELLLIFVHTVLEACCGVRDSRVADVPQFVERIAELLCSVSRQLVVDREIIDVRWVCRDENEIVGVN